MRTRNAPTMMQNSAKTASTSIIFFTGAESIIKRDNNNTHTDGADHGADTPGPSLSIYTLLWSKGLFPYYVISYNKQGSFQMITKDYSKGPRVVGKDYVLWKIQNMQEIPSMP